MKINLKDLIISPSLEFMVKITLILGNSAIFLGIGFATIQYFHSVNQYNQTERFNNAQIVFEKTKNTFEVINKVNDSEFLNSLAKIKKTKSLNNNDIINSLNLVFNTYSLIAIVYNNNIADNKIIARSIKQELISFVKLPLFIKTYTDEDKSEIIQMVNNITNGVYKQ